MIDDLKPNTEYEFTVKIIKGRRQQSPWSLVVTNRTQEAAPMSPPRDLNVHITNNKGSNDAGEVILTWRAPKFPNGKINGYVIQYTTNRKAEDQLKVMKRVATIAAFRLSGEDGVFLKTASPKLSTIEFFLC